MNTSRFANIVAWLATVVFGGGGLWALIGPQSFYESVALFEPYNQHFLQDIGAFQIGLASILVLALLDTTADALSIALLGGGIASIAHTVSHVVGRDLGGTPETDIPTLAILGGLMLAAGVLRRSARVQ
ncbi:MAG: hypothetical protein HKN07_15500 [Acidimicrobiia bacterium]|nr:hypothetical protein [Acidimicrobiia bacterium]